MRKVVISVIDNFFLYNSFPFVGNVHFSNLYPTWSLVYILILTLCLITIEPFYNFSQVYGIAYIFSGVVENFSYACTFMELFLILDVVDSISLIVVSFVSYFNPP